MTPLHRLPLLLAVVSLLALGADDRGAPPAAPDPATVVPLVEPKRPPRVLPTAPPASPPTRRPPIPRRSAPKPTSRPKSERISPDVEAMLMGRRPGERPAKRSAARPAWTKPPEGLVTVSGVRDRVVYRKGYIGGIPVHVIVANLRHPEVKVGAMVARGGIGHAERFESMLRRAHPTAALTGTFFGIRNNLPTGDLVVNRRNLYRGFIGTALAITNGNVVSFITTGYKEAPSWHLFDTVMRTGPRLVEERELVVAPQEEGFRTLGRHVPRTRTAVAITARSQLLLVAVKRPVSLYRLGLLMQHMGAYHAAALDGGTSTALSMGGRVIASPGRRLTNLLVVYSSRGRYERAMPHLVPPRRRAKTVVAPVRDPSFCPSP